MTQIVQCLDFKKQDSISSARLVLDGSLFGAKLGRLHRNPRGTQGLEMTRRVGEAILEFQIWGLSSK